MTNNAAEYADSILSQIEEGVSNGAPFGISEGYGDVPEGQELGAYDYLEGILDIQYIVNSDRTYRGARVCIAFGGPTAWINTQSGQLEVAWWSAPEYRRLPGDFIDALDDALSELWDMGA